MLSVSRLDQGNRERDIGAFGFLRRKLAVHSQHFLGQNSELRLVLAVFVPDIGVGPLTVPVRIENLVEPSERHSAVGHGFPMEPGQGRMKSAAKGQTRRLKGPGKKIDVLELVLETALGIEADLRARKVFHLRLFSLRREGSRSPGSPQAW